MPFFGYQYLRKTLIGTEPLAEPETNFSSIKMKIQTKLIKVIAIENIVC